MTSFNIETRLPHPIAEVFAAYRDELPALAKFIPDVKSVEVVERKDEGDVARLLNRWRAAAQIPGPLKSFISEDKLMWMDHASWDAGRRQCTWSLDFPAFKDAVTCKGETHFYDEGGATRMTIAGDLQVDATKVGAPRLIAGGLGKTIETFAVAFIKPSQERVGKAVARYLDERKKA